MCEYPLGVWCEEQFRERAKIKENQDAGQQNCGPGVWHPAYLEEERYCVEILNQIAAVRSALDGLGIEILMRHLESCVLDHDAQGATRERRS